MQLGCGEHTAIVVDRDSGHKLLQVDQPLLIRWSRIRNKVSDAVVEIRSGECCEQLSNVRPWRHELVVYRSGDQVWQGPITSISADPDTAVIEAEDLWAWLDVRYPREDLELEGDVADVALDLIREGLLHPDGRSDETGVLSNLMVTRTGVHTSREYEAYRSSVGSSLRSLAGSALNMAFLGRRLVMWGTEPLGRVSILQDKDFLEGLEVVHDGRAAASRVIVLGADGIVATAGGTDPYYGLVERVINDSSITDEGTAESLARLQAGLGMPPPIYISPGSRARLADTAPVRVSDLVPGVVVPLWSEQTCFTVYQDLILDQVTVEQDDRGESVSIGVESMESWGAEVVSGIQN